MVITNEEIDRQYEYMRRVRGMVGEGKKAFIQTFGRQQNEADSALRDGL